MTRTIQVILLGICISLCQVAMGATWYVAPPPLGDDLNPGTEEQPFATIQKGIDSSTDADTVIVAEGTYVENIHFNAKNITLTSTDPLDPAVVANTIIDGDQAGSVVTFSGSETIACVLTGLTVRNGNAENGGGICGNDTWASINNNVITANSASVHDGGGLWQCKGVVENNIITANSADESGGGLSGCNGIIRDNNISGNYGNIGGGLSFCGGTIDNNVIADNSAACSGGGSISAAAPSRTTSSPATRPGTTAAGWVTAAAQ